MLPVSLRRRLVRAVAFLTLSAFSPLSAAAQATASSGFAPGTRTIVDLNFAGTPVGRFPNGLRHLQGNMEVVDKDGVRMLRASSPSEFVLQLPEALPKDFTVEFEVIPKACCNPVDLMFEGVISGSRSSVSAQIEWDADHFAVVGGNPEMFQMDMPAAIAATLPSTLTTVAVSFEDEIVKMYTNGRRLYTLSGRKFVRGQVLRISLGGQDDDKYAVYLARVRVADMKAAIVTSNAPQAGPRSVTASSGSSITSASPAEPLGRAPGSVSILSNGPAPTGLTITGTPGLASLAWDAVSGATGYHVHRTVLGSTNWTALTATPIPGTGLANDQVPDPLGTYTYRVTAYQSNGQFGTATADFSPPAPADPSNLTATLVPPASVRLTWTPVSGATEYVVSGPGIPANARASTTDFSVMTAPVGLNAYRVASVFPPGKVLTNVTAWPSAVLKVPPVPLVPFLSMPNGLGSLADYNRHTCEAANWIASELVWPNTWCTNGVTNDPDLLPLLQLFSIQAADIWNFQDRGVMVFEPPNQRTDFFNWLWGQNGTKTVEAGFADRADLNLGRIVGCVMRGSGATAATLCWASSHGLFYPERTNDLTIIVQTANDARFFSFSSKCGGYTGSVCGENMRADAAKRMDAQGKRFLPHVCLSCHGGQYDAQTGKVTGATLLALDSRGFTLERPSWAESIRQVNAILYASPVAPGVKADIAEMYQGRHGLAGATVDPAYVPPGWAQQPNVYLNIYRPYCKSCHTAMQGPLAFRGWGDLVRERARVQRAVCAGTMPHAEVPFKASWDAAGPTVSMPGVLLAALGYPGC